jgi:ABC-2 type transport system ATP-binding protein
LRLANADQRARALEVVSRVIGDGVLPATDPTDITARLASAGQGAAVLAALAESGVDIAQFSVGSPSLDEVFLALTGHPAEVPAEEAKK